MSTSVKNSRFGFQMRRTGDLVGHRAGYTSTHPQATTNEIPSSEHPDSGYGSDQDNVEGNDTKDSNHEDVTAQCSACANRTFEGVNELHDHCIVSHTSVYCIKCKRLFIDASALSSHLVNLGAGNKNHQDTSTGIRDNRATLTETDGTKDGQQITAKQGHWCMSCIGTFDTDEQLHDHCIHKHTSRYCFDCRRMFRSRNNLSAHRASKKHAAQQFPCPGGCGHEAFVSCSALSIHLMAGSCTAGISRRDLDSHVLAEDSDNILTTPSVIVPVPAALYDSTSNLASAQAVEQRGAGFSCHMCDKVCKTAYGLTAHIKSSKHTGPGPIFRCPGCKTLFCDFAALVKHVENPHTRIRCSLGSRRRGVLRVVDLILKGVKVLA